MFAKLRKENIRRNRNVTSMKPAQSIQRECGGRGDED